jgi:hypothetical protein
MRRVNPATGKHFRRGDARLDGFIFFAYTNKKKLDGYFKEIWLSPEASGRALEGDRKRKRVRRHGHSGTDTGTNP